MTGRRYEVRFGLRPIPVRDWLRRGRRGDPKIRQPGGQSGHPWRLACPDNRERPCMSRRDKPHVDLAHPPVLLRVRTTVACYTDRYLRPETDWGLWHGAKHCVFFHGPGGLPEEIDDRVAFGRWQLENCLCHIIEPSV